MSIAEVIVHKSLGGHKWSNTHAIQIGADSGAAPTSADLITAGAGTAFTTANTSGTPPDILHAIVAAERALMYPDVTITDILVTDGKRNTGPSPSTIYASISMNLACVMTGTVAGNALVPGAVDALIHRNVVGFGHKPGRLFLRGSILNTQVVSTGPRMIAWLNNTAPTALTSAMPVASGFLAPYFYGGASASTAMYVLPLYLTPKQFAAAPGTVKVGTLYGVVPISSWALVGPVVRQVPRGRKKKAA